MSDFAKSPGLAGVCALVAASLALWGIMRQVEVARHAQRLQQISEARRAWWSSFEWVAARAVPAKSDDLPLPYDVILSSLTALYESATDPVQQRAVGAITDVASEMLDSKDAVGDELPASESGSTTPSQERRVLEALRAYSAATANSPAESAAVDAQLYEANVMEALQRVTQIEQPIHELGAGYAMRPDALVTVRGARVIVDVKAYTQRGRKIPLQALNQIVHLMEASRAAGAVIVAPVPLGELPQDTRRPIRSVVWNSPADDQILSAALDDFGGAPPGP
ncbi:hypothetical protein [Microbacterium sp. bgisy189]|uniref:hypothetical protein n=1 Tax=Microbacterium sp. bgisy189 TaxID=3413798 RepID=UPI003EBEFFD5